MTGSRIQAAAVALLTFVALLGFSEGPAAAHTDDPSPPPACTDTMPLVTPCSAAVSSSGSNYTVTVPGVGTLSFSLDPNGAVTSASATAADGMAVDVVKADSDGAVAKFSDTSTGKTYVVDADVPTTPTTAPATVQATVRSPEDDRHCDHDGDGHWDGDGGTYRQQDYQQASWDGDGHHDGDHHGGHHDGHRDGWGDGDRR